jgi:uncharacterized protein
MIERNSISTVLQALSLQASVALIGPRQVGKTTLAIELGEQRNAIYLDLEASQDREKLANPAAFFAAFEDRLVILDEIHRVPELFLSLRGVIDAGRRKGKRVGRFLLLGSASLDLMRQSGESLAGRISYIAMTGLSVLELPASDHHALWLRGGFPDSFLAAGDAASLAWRKDFITTYLERDVPMFGPRVPAELLRRFWTMLAHNQGGLHNASRLAAALEVSSQTIGRYTDLLVDLLLVRRLEPYHINSGKRLVKSPKLYIRDSGLLHALLNIGDTQGLLGHPVLGMSWEGFAIENLVSAAPMLTVAGFYRTSNGAEIDLLLELPGGERWAIEIKRSHAAKPGRGFYEACEDLKPARRWVVHAGTDAYPIGPDVDAIGLAELCAKLSALGR